MSENNELKGLGGWLILVGIGLIASIGLITYATVPLLSILDSEVWAFLTDYQPDIFNEKMKGMLWGMIIANAVLLAGFLYLIYLFFKKHYLFPTAFIVIQIIAFIFALPYSYVANLLDPSDPAPFFDASFFRSALFTLIWITYMLKSVRVKNTFVEGRKARIESIN